MLQATNKDAAHCYRRAVEWRRKTDGARTKFERDDFLDMEQRWIALAQSYEFAERLERTTRELDRRRENRK